jgi:glycosyltransferase involved in cell wall biosynthesis
MQVEWVAHAPLASMSGIGRYLRVASDRVHVVYRWVHAGLCPSPAHEVAGLKERHRLPDTYSLFLGSTAKCKNVHGLLQAYACLRRMGETRPLVVAGVGQWEHSAIAETLQELNLERHVIFTGYVPDADLPALYTGAALFVFPSLYEGFGLPPLEAMACGTPVICSNAASLPEVVGDAAITVDPHDVEGLAQAMQQALMGGALREEMRQKGLARLQRLKAERAAQETMAVYRGVMG